ncbi:MAG: STAS domain-containing protein [Candidatus Sulfotelmatobacter sp.]
MLNVTIEKLAETVVLHCVGRIVRGDETALLCAAVGQHGRNIILDLEKTDAIDAAGVGALISLHAAGVYLRLINPSKAIRDVLRFTHLDSIFEIAGAPLSINHREYEEESARHQASPPFPSPLLGAAS